VEWVEVGLLMLQDFSVFRQLALGREIVQTGCDSSSEDTPLSTIDGASSRSMEARSCSSCSWSLVSTHKSGAVGVDISCRSMPQDGNGCHRK
jgi:hypothetical protein